MEIFRNAGGTFHFWFKTKWIFIKQLEFELRWKTERVDFHKFQSFRLLSYIQLCPNYVEFSFFCLFLTKHVFTAVNEPHNFSVALDTSPEINSWPFVVPFYAMTSFYVNERKELVWFSSVRIIIRENFNAEHVCRFKSNFYLFMIWKASLTFDNYLWWIIICFQFR